MSHHYGEDSTNVHETGSAFNIEFRNKVSGAIITMRIPKEGALEDPGAQMTFNLAGDVAREIAHHLRVLLDKEPAMG